MYAKPNIVVFWTKCLYSRGLFFAIIFLLSTFHFQLSTARPTTIAFWNTENLFDTIPSPFYDDAEYTPRGSRRWNTERYTAKIANLARVIDEMAADIVGLAEVENEAVVRDLVRALRTDYNYIHRTSGDSRGIDVALLYKGDRFFPDADSTGNPTGVRMVRSGTGREFLHITGELGSDRIELIVCHLASNLNGDAYRRRNMAALRSLLETRLTQDPAAKIIVMGDMNATPGDRMVRQTLGDVSSSLNFMVAPHYALYRAGLGSYNYRDRWYLYDWMMLSPALARSGGAAKAKAKTGVNGATGATGAKIEAWIYAKEYMTEQGTAGAGRVRRPLRTFYGRSYIGGYSDHFPVGISIVN
jgi:endonuclease/exonuclease/phosphatase family metal-dependent hydrolase